MKSSRWFAQLLVSAATVAAMGAMALTAGPAGQRSVAPAGTAGRKRPWC